MENGVKCEVLQISLGNSAPVNYCLYDNPLRIVNEAKYLGVLLDSKLNFNRHIETICKTANDVLAFLKCNLYSYVVVINRLEIRHICYT